MYSMCVIAIYSQTIELVVRVREIKSSNQLTSFVNGHCITFAMISNTLIITYHNSHM